MLDLNIATAVVEPNSLFREGLARILSSAGFDVVASASSVDSAVLTSFENRESCLLVISASDDANETVAQINRFKKFNPSNEARQKGHVAVLGHRLDHPGIISIFRAGAGACLTRGTTSESLVKALELVISGVTIVPQDIWPLVFSNERSEVDRIGAKSPTGAGAAEQTDATQEHPPHKDLIEEALQLNGSDTPHLSAQEKRILRCLVDGASNKAIARKVDIAEATVKVHVKAILRKIRLQNRTQAAVWALNHGPSIFGYTQSSGESAPAPTSSGRETANSVPPLNGSLGCGSIGMLSEAAK